MSTIRHHKRQARLRAAVSGNSLQSELNAIARENGHAAWGGFQAALKASATATEQAASDAPETLTSELPGTATQAPSTPFRSVDQGGMDIEVDWNTPLDQREGDWRRIPFMPAFNALGPKFLPEDPDALELHVERIAHVLIPQDAREGGLDGYFEDKGRQAMVGFLLVETGRAARDGRVPSIPALIDWVNGGLRDAADENDRRREWQSRLKADGFDYGLDDGDVLSDWLRGIVAECTADGYHPRAAVEIMPLASMAPRERAGVLGTMDRGLLPFKNRHVRERTS